MADADRLLDAAVGAAVTVVFAFLPFSSVLGGAVAGYLDGGDLRDGAAVGALSGLLAAVPVLIVFLFVGSVLSVVLLGIAARGMAVIGGALLAAGLAFAAVYLVGLGAIGGALGAYVAAEAGDR